jgi:hypothetical protein
VGYLLCVPGIMLDLTGEPRLGVTRKTQEWNAMLIRPELAKVRMVSDVLQQKPNMGIGINAMQCRGLPVWASFFGYRRYEAQLPTTGNCPVEGAMKQGVDRPSCLLQAH